MEETRCVYRIPARLERRLGNIFGHGSPCIHAFKSLQDSLHAGP